MSVFRVKLQNAQQGTLDVNPATGVEATTSIQRTVYVMGPNRINRELADGQTFTDCNYWKKFAYPQVAYTEAFIYVVTDDGSTWSEDGTGNVEAVSYSKTITAGTTYTDTGNEVDFLTDHGNFATFCQIANTSASGSVIVRINETATFTLLFGNTQIFNTGDLAINTLEFNNSASGAVDQTIEVVAAVAVATTS
jgi:hypothetical protein